MPVDPACQSSTNPAPATTPLRVLVQSRSCTLPLETRRALLVDVPGLSGRRARSLANAWGSLVPRVLGYLVVREFGSDHNVMKIFGRILSNTTQVTHVFEAGRREARIEVQVIGKPALVGVTFNSPEVSSGNRSRLVFPDPDFRRVQIGLVKAGDFPLLIRPPASGIVLWNSLPVSPTY